MLWNGGISFGGVIAFILADLLHPADHQLSTGSTTDGLDDILRIVAAFYVAMVVTGYAIEGFVFGGLGLDPAEP